MKEVNYLFAKAMRCMICLAVVIATGLFAPSLASAQGINCIPSTWVANYWGCDGIRNVSIGSLNHQTEDCAPNNGNNDYTGSGLSEPLIIATIPQNMSVKVMHDYPYTNGYVYVWIDYNRNQSFDEPPVYTYSTTTPGETTLNFTVTLPISSGTGRTRMRVKFGCYPYINTPIDNPCNGPAMGEWEDYIVNITPPFPDPTPTGLVLTAPGSSASLGFPIGTGTYDLGFRLANLSGAGLESIQVNYSFTGPTSGTGAFTWSAGPLATGSNTVVKLPMLANIVLTDALNPYNVTITLSNPVGTSGSGDSNPNNNTLVASVAPALDGGTPENPKIYFVGGTFVPGAWFPNLTNVGTALTYGGILGPVEFRIRPGTYNDQMLLGQVSQTINGIPGMSAATPIVFGPDAAAGANRSNVIMSSANTPGNGNYGVQINAADYLTFKDMTFTVNSAFAGKIFWLRNGTQSINIQNCVFNGRTVSSSSITEDALVYSEPGNALTDLSITGNTFNSGDFGLNLDGGGSGPVVTGVVISGNTFNNFYSRGISIQRYTVPLIQKNTIVTNSSNGSSVYGIFLNLIQSGATVIQNTITIPVPSFGINFSNNTSVAGAATVIANNMINVGNGSMNTYGIYASSYNTTNIFQNTINVNTLSSSLAAGLYLVSPGANTRIINNIIYNRGGGYSYYHGNTLYPTESNYNNIYSAGPYVGYAEGASQSTLTSFSSATAKDANSVSKAVIFTGANNTYLGAMDPQLRGTNSYNNTSVGNVNTDFNDVIRRVPPYMGAHELIPTANFAGGTMDSGCIGRTTVLSPVVSFTSQYPSPFTLPVLPSNVRYQWTKGGIPIFDDGVRIFGTSTSTLTILNSNALDEDNYSLNAIIKDGASEFTFVDTLTYQYSVFLRVNEPVVISTPPLSQVVCRGGNIVLSIVATKGRIWGYQWQRDGVNLTNEFGKFNADEVRGANSVSLTLTNVQYGASGNYRAIIATSCGKNFDTSAVAVVYVAKPTQIITPPASQVAQEAGSVRFEVNVAEATIGFNNNLTPVQY
ncbi:MAG: right-handed parallel beta-helix repeat-containing protein, partial [Ignavibacteriae bacterium]|nr:right-handed parallel beta-helix repeat-containing protein [Ignavibacteriota bacterium]